MSQTLRRAPLAVAVAIAATATALALSVMEYRVDPTLGFGASQAIVAGPVTGPPTVRVGAAAPNFELGDLQGNTVRLSEALGERGTWLTFWATWCGPCLAESPDTEAVVRRYADRGLNYLGVSVGENHVVVEAFMRGRYTWKALLDPQRKASELYAVRMLPTHIFIGADGLVKEIRPGILNRAQMEARVKELLGKPGG